MYFYLSGYVMTGEIIKNLRKGRGLTQRQLADALHIDRSSVGKYETGSMPSGEMLLRLAEFFGVTVDYLCERDGEAMLAENDAERRLLTMFRRTDGLSDERREEITEYIGSTIDMYLRAIASDGESGGRGI